MTDDQARNVQQYEYDSFGNQHDMKNRIKQPYGYTGREHDRETGLRYYRARYYDGEVGRFISEDSIGLRSGSKNFYNYVDNNPITYVDPLGRNKVIGELLAALGEEIIGDIVVYPVVLQGGVECAQHYCKLKRKPNGKSDTLGTCFTIFSRHNWSPAGITGTADAVLGCSDLCWEITCQDEFKEACCIE